MDAAALALAQGIAALGATGLLALLFVLWLNGKLHSDNERKEWERRQTYIEALRVEAVTDRKAADARVDTLVAQVTESNILTRRSLDLNEKLVERITGGER